MPPGRELDDREQQTIALFFLSIHIAFFLAETTSFYFTRKPLIYHVEDINCCDPAAI